MGLMEMRSPDYFDKKGEQQHTLAKIEQPAIGELDIDSPIFQLGALEIDSPVLGVEELDTTSTIHETGEPKSPVDEEREVAQPDERADDGAVKEPDEAEREERQLGESIRRGDDASIEDQAGGQRYST